MQQNQAQPSPQAEMLKPQTEIQIQHQEPLPATATSTTPVLTPLEQSPVQSQLPTQSQQPAQHSPEPHAQHMQAVEQPLLTQPQAQSTTQPQEQGGMVESEKQQATNPEILLINAHQEQEGSHQVPSPVEPHPGSPPVNEEQPTCVQPKTLVSTHLLYF